MEHSSMHICAGTGIKKIYFLNTTTQESPIQLQGQTPIAEKSDQTRGIPTKPCGGTPTEKPSAASRIPSNPPWFLFINDPIKEYKQDLAQSRHVPAALYR